MSKKNIKYFFTVIIILSLVLLNYSLFAATKRFALVIGNSSYQDAPLKNPTNDANDMATKLRQMGFEVEKLIDADDRSMKRAITRLGEKLYQPNSVGLFYFAGHGVQFKGANYLIPIGANIESEADVKFEAVDARRVLNNMALFDNHLNLIILDACRNNPYANNFRSAARGLAKMDAPTGSLILYATSPGEVAADGKGRNGLFTEKLMQAMNNKELKIEDVFKQTAIAVSRETSRKQIPYFEGVILGNFYLTEGQSAASQPVTSSISSGSIKPANPEKSVALVKPVQPQASSPAKEIQREKKHSPKTYIITKPASRKTTIKTASLDKSVNPFTKRLTFKPGKQFSDPLKVSGNGPKMIVIPKGQYEMGLSFSIASAAAPRHRVAIDYDLAVSQHEISIADFKRFIKDTGYKTDAEKNLLGCFNLLKINPLSIFSQVKSNWKSPAFDQNDNHPVVCVSWNDAKAYTKWLSDKTGHRYRLLTEAEWEYAARAGSTKENYWSGNNNQSCKYTNFSRQLSQSSDDAMSIFHEVSCDDGFKQTAPVTAFKANSFGIHNMLGNVAEWTEDCTNLTYHNAPTDGSAWKDGMCDSHVVRGGGFDMPISNITVTYRQFKKQNSANNGVGFRVARDL
jgi:formylglycine-generating enzyme required for sulfatase activity